MNEQRLNKMISSLAIVVGLAGISNPGLGITSIATVDRAPATDGGNIGGDQGALANISISGVGDNDPWINVVPKILNAYKQQAILHQKEPKVAAAYFVAGLKRVLRHQGTNPEHQGVTYHFVQETLNDIEAFENNIQINNDNDQIILDGAIFDLARANYDAILSAYEKLDVKLYMLFLNASCGGIHANYDLREFENETLRYADSRIEYFRTHYETEKQGGEVDARYSNLIFLNLLEQVTDDLASILGSPDQDGSTDQVAEFNNPDLFPKMTLSVGVDLRNLSNEINRQLAGQGNYPTDTLAVQYTAQRLKEIQFEIKDMLNAAGRK